jgi:hypothetical protein
MATKSSVVLLEKAIKSQMREDSIFLKTTFYYVPINRTKIRTYVRVLLGHYTVHIVQNRIATLPKV